MSKDLDKILADARREFRPETVDWDAVDRGLFARIDGERRAARDRASRERGQLWMAGAAALAAAGIVMVLVAKPSRELAMRDEGGDAMAAMLVEADGADPVLVNGKAASIGASVRRGDVL